MPHPLRELYDFCDGASLPFGDIYPHSAAVAQSKRVPFRPDWFVFGRDRYFNFWLCAFAEDDALWITAWDHEAGVEIDGAVWATPEEFLIETLEEYLEDQ